NHRVKNTLATVQSLAWQSARQDVAPRIAQERFQERLLALSRTHNLLNETLWEGASLKAILETELQPYATSATRIALDGPTIHLQARLAVVLGMAFHELATNAVKHGALSTGSGRLRVGWRFAQAGQGGILTVDWSEREGPVVGSQPVLGFGSRLLRQTITRELAGSLDVRFEQEGMSCVIVVPIDVPSRQAA
ncbi:MAG: sensor histidine kinase, partial [Microvirga sp.]